MERFSNKSGMMVKNQESGGWVKWDDVKPLNETERLFHAQTFIKDKLVFANVSKSFTLSEIGQVLDVCDEVIQAKLLFIRIKHKM